MRSRWYWMALGWLCLATSCDDEVDAEKQERQAREAVLAELSTIVCARADECGCEASELAGGCTTLESDLWRARLNVGHDRALTWDGECVEAIQDAVSAADCAEAPLGVTHPCHEYCAVFHGEREIGESCKGFDSLVSDCAQGLVCAQGHCVEPCTVLSGQPLGERCSDPDSGEEFGTCAQGLFCNREVGRCAEAPALGSACIDYADCGPDAYCDWDGSICRALPGLGASCSESPRCVQGLACHYHDDYKSPTCVQPAAADEGCRDRPCVEGLACDFDEVCRGPVDLGQRCDHVGCIDGLVCEHDAGFETNYVCRVPPDIGETCASGVCGSGAWCDFADLDGPTCVAAAANGEACTGHSRCTSAYCPAGWCEPRPDLGEDCSELFLCVPGLYCDGSTCRPSLTALPAVCEYEGW